jgi:non-ribosomal peptide synthase protein (TIGR01720 family)
MEMPPIFDTALLEQIIAHLLVHHDALRLHFALEEKGWQQVHDNTYETVSFLRVDLSTVPGSEQAVKIEEVESQLQANLNLSAGPLIRMALFDLGSMVPARLLIVIHHLIVDRFSWRILLEDFWTAHHQLAKGEGVQLPPKTISFQEWSRRLTQHVKSEALRGQAEFWRAVPDRRKVTPLPKDFENGENTVASAHIVSISLSAEETHNLLHHAPKAYNTEINDLLLTSLAQTLAHWTGVRSLFIDMEEQGRESLFEDVDLSRTVGWFTSIFPVLLDLDGVDDQGEALKSIKEQLRRIPNRGIGYGLLRYLSCDEETVKQLQTLPQSEIAFAYLGQFDQGNSESIRLSRSRLIKRSKLLEIEASIIDHQLRLLWIYSDQVHQRSTIEMLGLSYLETLRSLITHCTFSNAGGYTPSDFAKARVSQSDLDNLMAKLRL